MTTFHYRRAFRDALHTTEREAITREPQPPEPCNFCAPDDLVEPKDRFDELAQVLGRYWLLWLIAFTGLCVIAIGLTAYLVHLVELPA